MADIEQAGINTFIVDDLPEEVAFVICLSFTASADEIGRTFPVDVEVCAPGMRYVQELDFEYEVLDHGSSTPDYRVTGFHGIVVNFIADSEGAYSVELKARPDSGFQTDSDIRGRTLFVYVARSDEAKARMDEEDTH